MGVAEAGEAGVGGAFSDQRFVVGDAVLHLVWCVPCLGQNSDDDNVDDDDESDEYDWGDMGDFL